MKFEPLTMHFKKTILTVSFAALALSSCDDKSTQVEATPPAPPQVKIEKPTPDTKARAVISAPSATISSAGVSGLAGQTPFDLWAVKHAFDGYDVFSGRMEMADRTIPTFEVHGEVGLVMRIEPDESGDWVGKATATTHEFKGPLGETIGVSLLGEIPVDILGMCQNDQIEDANILTCKSDSIARFIRVFQLPDDYSGLLSDIPSDVIRSSKLVEMSFIPDNRGL